MKIRQNIKHYFNPIGVIVFIGLVSCHDRHGILWDNYSHTRFGIPVEPQLVPSDQLYGEDGKHGGLTGSYHSDLALDRFTAVRFDSSVSIDLKDKLNKAIAKNEYLSKHPLPEGITPNERNVCWSGEIETKGAGAYHVFAPHDGVKLWPEGKEIINAWEYLPRLVRK